MTRLTLLLSTLSISASIYAQPGNKTTAMGSRLIAAATTEFDTSIDLDGTFMSANGDTANYFYSGSRGGAVYHTLQYDVAVGGYFYDSATNSFGNIPNSMIRQTFDAANNIAASTLLVRDMSDTAIWDSLERNLYIYDSNRDTLSYIAQSWTGSAWQNGESVTHTYDIYNNCTSQYDQYWDNVSGAWYTIKADTFINTYNAHHQPSEIIHQRLDTGTGSWADFQKTHFIYDFSDLLQAAYWQQWDTVGGGEWRYEEKDYYNYDADGRLTDWKIYWCYSPDSVTDCEPIHDRSFSYYADGDLHTDFYDDDEDSTLESYTESFHLPQHIEVTTHKGEYDMNFTYNSYGQVTSETEVGPGIAIYNRYYYETFDLSTVAVNMSSGKCIVYPVPAGNAVNIDIAWDNAQSFSISIFDMLGRSIKTWHENACKQYHKEITTEEMAAGDYIIKIQGTDGLFIRKMQISK